MAGTHTVLEDEKFPDCICADAASGAPSSAEGVFCGSYPSKTVSAVAPMKKQKKTGVYSGLFCFISWKPDSN